jgi:hypothetical protein
VTVLTNRISKVSEKARRFQFAGIKKSCSEKIDLFVVVFGLFCLRTLSVEHSRQPGFYEAQPEYH